MPLGIASRVADPATVLPDLDGPTWRLTDPGLPELDLSAALDDEAEDDVS
jgi:hypothetical protein